MVAELVQPYELRSAPAVDERRPDRLEGEGSLPAPHASADLGDQRRAADLAHRLGRAREFGAAARADADIYAVEKPPAVETASGTEARGDRSGLFEYLAEARLEIHDPPP
jgi:hypothetical protein